MCESLHKNHVEKYFSLDDTIVLPTFLPTIVTKCIHIHCKIVVYATRKKLTIALYSLIQFAIAVTYEKQQAFFALMRSNKAPPCQQLSVQDPDFYSITKQHDCKLLGGQQLVSIHLYAIKSLVIEKPQKIGKNLSPVLLARMGVLSLMQYLCFKDVLQKQIKEILISTDM